MHSLQHADHDEPSVIFDIDGQTANGVGMLTDGGRFPVMAVVSDDPRGIMLSLQRPSFIHRHPVMFGLLAALLGSAAGYAAARNQIG